MQHIREWQESVLGWGGTKTAIERLHTGAATWRTSGNPALGNGVLMKLAPLCLLHALTLPPLPEPPALAVLDAQAQSKEHKAAVQRAAETVFAGVCCPPGG